MLLYHLDRAGTIFQDTKIQLLPPSELLPEVRNSRFIEEFSDGISQFGVNYLTPGEYQMQLVKFDPFDDFFLPVSTLNQCTPTINSRLIEFSLEIVRRATFGICPPGSHLFSALALLMNLKSGLSWKQILVQSLYAGTRQKTQSALILRFFAVG